MTFGVSVKTNRTPPAGNLGSDSGSQQGPGQRLAGRAAYRAKWSEATHQSPPILRMASAPTYGVLPAPSATSWALQPRRRGLPMTSPLQTRNRGWELEQLSQGLVGLVKGRAEARPACPTAIPWSLRGWPFRADCAASALTPASPSRGAVAERAPGRPWPRFLFSCTQAAPLTPHSARWRRPPASGLRWCCSVYCPLCCHPGGGALPSQHFLSGQASGSSQAVGTHSGSLEVPVPLLPGLIQARWTVLPTGQHLGPGPGPRGKQLSSWIPGRARGPSSLDVRC